MVVNALGLGAKSLVGVEDDTVRPIKGQTILIEGPQGFNKCIMGVFCRSQGSRNPCSS